MERLIRANLHFLKQAEALLDRMDDGQFSEPVASFYGSSVGGHLRHCLEHYLSFLGGMGSGKIDYDDRRRDVAMETVTSDATSVIGDIASRLEALLESDPPVGVLVKMDCGGDEIEWQPSTMGRELQFLVSHTVHHYAMIGGICSALNLELEEDFGVAPSTLRHRAHVGAS